MTLNQPFGWFFLLVNKLEVKKTMKRVLLSLATISLLVGLGTFATRAFFSDVETSVGNTFTAGNLDLKVDSNCTYNGQSQSSCTWASKDLTTGDYFFNFGDVKPGDSGEDTVSLTVTDNDAYLCAYIQNLVKDDNGCNEPETTAGDTTCGPGQGELQDNIFVTVWKDADCQNDLDAEDQILVDNQPIDSNNGVWSLGQLIADTKTCLGISWTLPSSVSNIVQGDSLAGDIAFYVEQVRNNPNFTCPSSLPQ